MSDTKPDGSPSADENGRRQGDRREQDAPFDGKDNRKDERRSGDDRRQTPRE